MAVGGGTRGTLGSVVVWTCGRQSINWLAFKRLELTSQSTVHDILTGSDGFEHMMEAVGRCSVFSVKFM